VEDVTRNIENEKAETRMNLNIDAQELDNVQNIFLSEQ
jgi:hypothetical protein